MTANGRAPGAWFAEGSENQAGGRFKADSTPGCDIRAGRTIHVREVLAQWLSLRIADGRSRQVQGAR